MRCFDEYNYSNYFPVITQYYGKTLRSVHENVVQYRYWNED